MNQILMILLISALVLVHEAGHFIAARLFGVRVTRFGIGMPFGPEKKLFRWNNTDFYIHAFLFGGYVAFPNDEMFESKEDDNKPLLEEKLLEIIKNCNKESKLISYLEKRIEKIKEKQKKEEEYFKENYVLPPDSPELYENKKIGQKLIIVSAGVIMNVIFAIVLVLFCAMYYHKLPSSTQDITIEGLSPKITSNINTKDIKKGYKLFKINNQKIDNLYQLTFFAKNSKMFDDYAQEDLYQKNLKELKKLNNIKDENKIISNGIQISLIKSKPEKELSVNKDVLKGLEKYKKNGIELDEKQVKIRDNIKNQKFYTADGKTTLNDVALATADTFKPLTITLLRNNKEILLEDVEINNDGILGILLKVEDIYADTKTPKDIVVKSFDYIYTTTATMLYSLWQLFTGKVSASDMHGVIAVVKVGGDIIASKGFLNGFLLTAMISINLAIMNILPIPALDGGHVMFLIIEKLTGKKPSKELSEKITNFFFFLLIILMVAICYNDIFALVTKKF